MMKWLILAIVACIGATGCAATPQLTREQIEAGDYGHEITAAQAGSIIKSRLNITLLDPESAKFRAPTETIKYWAIDDKGVYHFGWLAYYGVNAKNRYGEYTGERMYAAMIRNNIILGEFEDMGTHWVPDPNDHKLYP